MLAARLHIVWYLFDFSPPITVTEDEYLLARSEPRAFRAVLRRAVQRMLVRHWPQVLYFPASVTAALLLFRPLMPGIDQSEALPQAAHWIAWGVFVLILGGLIGGFVTLLSLSSYIFDFYRHWIRIARLATQSPDFGSVLDTALRAGLVLRGAEGVEPGPAV